MRLNRLLKTSIAVFIFATGLFSGCQSFNGNNSGSKELLAGLKAWRVGSYNQAYRIFRKLAEEGNPAAQDQLGVCLLTGKGTEPNHEEAVKWFKKAAKAGHAGAQGHLGLMYHRGKGVKIDLVKAYAWYNTARSAGVQTGKMLYKLEEQMTDRQLRKARVLTRRFRSEHPPEQLKSGGQNLAP